MSFRYIKALKASLCLDFTLFYMASVKASAVQFYHRVFKFLEKSIYC